MATYNSKNTIYKIILINIVIMLIMFFSVYGCVSIEQSRLTAQEKYEYSENCTLSEERADYNSDVQFVNIRSLKGGKLKDNYIFRGASPYLDNNRTAFVNNFLSKWEVKYVVSLSESKEQIDTYVNNDTVKDMYFPKKYNNNEIIDEALNYESIDLNNSKDVKKIIKSFKSIIKSDGNIYVHCAIGRDRTGVYCELLEALADASYEEIVNDYMKSFENYSYLTYDLNPTKWEQIKSSGVDATLHTITKTNANDSLDNIDLCWCVKKLLVTNGMKETEIEELINKITK